MNNDVLSLIDNRMSLRTYAEKPITQEEECAITDAAIRAPTAGNMMLYSIIRIRDQKTKETLSRTCDNQPFIAKAPLVLIFLADLCRTFDYLHCSGIRNHCKEEGIPYKGPSKGHLFLAISDALIAAQTSVIAAESIGIGSCYIGDIMEQYETHRELLSLPNGTFPIGMLCLGHYPPSMTRIRRPRYEKKYIVHKERYHRMEHDELIEMFEGTDEKRKGGNYARALYTQKLASPFAMEMERSIEQILSKWDNEQDAR